MNPKIFRLIILILALFLLFAAIYSVLSTNISEDETSPDAHNCGELFTYPGFSIYKTKGDYFDKVSCVCQDGEIKSVPVFNIGDPSYYFDKDTVYKLRVKLCKGYILDKGCFYHDTFLNISIKDYYCWEQKNGVKGMPKDLISKLILDDDPFKEFWYVKNSKKSSFTIHEIEQLIVDDNLKAYFKRLK